RVRGREDLAEVVEAPDVLDLPGERVDGPERGDEEDGERPDVDDQERDERRRQERGRLRPRPSPERGRETKAGPSQRSARPCCVNRQALTRDLRPGSLPGVVVHAVPLAVPAVR